MKKRQHQAKYLEPSHQRKREVSLMLFKDAVQTLTSAEKELTMTNIIEETKKNRGVGIARTTFTRNGEIMRIWDEITGKKYKNYDFRDVNLNRVRPSKNWAHTAEVLTKWPVDKLVAHLIVTREEWLVTRSTNEELNIRVVKLEEEIENLKITLSKRNRS